MKNLFTGIVFVGLVVFMVHCFAVAIDKEVRNSQLIKALSINQGTERGIYE